MLDKGFENDIRNIISNTKQGAERQTMMCTLFSVTRFLRAHLHSCSQCDVAGCGAAACKHVPARPCAGNRGQRRPDGE